MTSLTTKLDSVQPADEAGSHLFDNWFDPIESAVRDRVRGLIEELIHGELDAVLSRPRYARGAKPSSSPASDTKGVIGHRHGHRPRALLGTFGRVEIARLLRRRRRLEHLHVVGCDLRLATDAVAPAKERDGHERRVNGMHPHDCTD